ncbi:hypothetical protein PHYSODRAFT_259374 [Phytophthora sojae]|uniref:Uncharacterized protein n=1 Tax=Phytophthora sojae (strain P6497) TaxID=1094619 RepID=G4Z4J0_PHYSP|nr:hypothetical protein PHYSODRAFT_259374 [Phytophthora sojae]EGZ20834.1 hypothetical protein PHYSODRAFT_259374 [Phytophthora sojae]|eukprot:XP_009523551.1 hypothetical protein PHYSODRAFT_259374 [Phytophthora sojae]
MADKPPSPTDQEAKAESNDEDIFTPRPDPEVTQPVDPVHQKEPAFYVGGKRFYAKSKAMKLDPPARTSPDALSDAWDVFVQSLVDDEASWMLTFHSLKNTFMTYTVEGEKLRVHQQTIGEGFPCCVLSEQKCPMCYADSLKAADHIRRGSDGMSDRLVRYIKQLDRRWARHALRREEDRRRVRALQEDIMDDITLAQAEPGKTDQRIRDIESDIYPNGLDSHQGKRASDGGQLITKAANIGSPTRGYLGAPGPSNRTSFGQLPVPSSVTMGNIDSSHAVMYEARNKHLFEEFLSDSVNTRTDKYGGRIDSTPRETYGYVVNKLCG